MLNGPPPKIKNNNTVTSPPPPPFVGTKVESTQTLKNEEQSESLWWLILLFL